MCLCSFMCSLFLPWALNIRTITTPPEPPSLFVPGAATSASISPVSTTVHLFLHLLLLPLVSLPPNVQILPPLFMRPSYCFCLHIIIALVPTKPYSHGLALTAPASVPPLPLPPLAPCHMPRPPHCACLHNSCHILGYLHLIYCFDLANRDNAPTPAATRLPVPPGRPHALCVLTPLLRPCTCRICLHCTDLHLSWPTGPHRAPAPTGIAPDLSPLPLPPLFLHPLCPLPLPPLRLP